VHFLLSLRVERESERGERRERGESEKWIMMNFFYSFFVLVGEMLTLFLMDGRWMDDGVFRFQVVRNHTYSRYTDVNKYTFALFKTSSLSLSYLSHLS
jgi:hypothetical protein